MAEIGQLKVGDRVAVDGQDGAFFVMHVDFETLSASLLPSDNGPILNKVPADTLIFLTAPEGQLVCIGSTARHERRSLDLSAG